MSDGSDSSWTILDTQDEYGDNHAEPANSDRVVKQLASAMHATDSDNDYSDNETADEVENDEDEVDNDEDEYNKRTMSDVDDHEQTIVDEAPKAVPERRSSETANVKSASDEKRIAEKARRLQQKRMKHELSLVMLALLITSTFALLAAVVYIHHKREENNIGVRDTFDALREELNAMHQRNYDMATLVDELKVKIDKYQHDLDRIVITAQSKDKEPGAYRYSIREVQLLMRLNLADENGDECAVPLVGDETLCKHIFKPKIIEETAPPAETQ